jgi:hypothetical protein
LEIKSREFSDLAQRLRPELVISGDRIIAGDMQLSAATVNALLRLDTDPNWVREVWEFFADSLHVVVDSVRPQVSIVVIPLPPSISQLLKQRDVIKTIGLPNGVNVKVGDAFVELSGIDPGRLAQADSVVKSLMTLPLVQARLPSGTAGMVVGRKHEKRMRLESMPGVRWVCVDGDVVTVVGDSERALNATLADIRKVTDRTTGELIVPSHMRGAFFGKDDQHRRSLMESTGCQANNPGKGERWVLEGPTPAAVDQFIRSAISQGRAKTGRVIETRQLTILDRSEANAPKSTTSISSQATTPKNGRQNVLSGPPVQPDSPFVAIILVVIAALMVIALAKWLLF